MAFTPLKYIYNDYFFEDFASKLSCVTKPFDKIKFIGKIRGSGWKDLELKQRMRRITTVLQTAIDKDFAKACKQITELTKIVDLTNYKYGDLAYMFLPDYIEVYGQEHFYISMETLKNITAFTSSEFAVRPFIIANQEKALALMTNWSLDTNFHISRLATEGCRPKLPWAVALKKLQEDPSPILPILTNLKNDTEDYVYRSVANNLNDISKDNPKLILSIAKEWNGTSKTTNWLVKHGLRTLLKKGNQEAMSIIGYGKAKDTEIDSFELKKEFIEIGEYLEFSFRISNKTTKKNRLEYAIFFLLKNGKLSKKVFKISEKEYKAGTKTIIVKKHNFKKISTRTYYKGQHEISIIVNGIEKAKTSFFLK